MLVESTLRDGNDGTEGGTGDAVMAGGAGGGALRVDMRDVVGGGSLLSV